MLRVASLKAVPRLHGAFAATVIVHATSSNDAYELPRPAQRLEHLANAVGGAIIRNDKPAGATLHFMWRPRHCLRHLRIPVKPQPLLALLQASVLLCFFGSEDSRAEILFHCSQLLVRFADFLDIGINKRIACCLFLEGGLVAPPALVAPHSRVEGVAANRLVQLDAGFRHREEQGSLD